MHTSNRSVEHTWNKQGEIIDQCDCRITLLSVEKKKEKKRKKKEEENLPDDLDFRVKRYSDENAYSFSDYKCSRYRVKKNGKDGSKGRDREGGKNSS